MVAAVIFQPSHSTVLIGMFSDFGFYRVGVISAHQKAISERCKGSEVDVVDRGDRGIRWPTLSLGVRTLSWTPKMRQVAKVEPCP
jgi:hypothetical protein